MTSLRTLVERVLQKRVSRRDSQNHDGAVAARGRVPVAQARARAVPGRTATVGGEFGHSKKFLAPTQSNVHEYAHPALGNRHRFEESSSYMRKARITSEPAVLINKLNWIF